MLAFKFILILLFAIFLSEFIHRFLPSVSPPMIQILLGACIALLPLHFKLELNPDLFLVLFIAPLIFLSSMLLDKKSYWKLKYPIMNLAFLLVFASVIGIGYFTHWLIPSIPLVVCFVFMAALAPTDDIAVISMGKRINIPPKIMNILTVESIINDASGIICFQFALLAVVTGSFSVTEALGRFILVGLGGIVVGLLLTLLKYFFLRWIRSLGMENIIMHVLFEILTPFLVYLVADMLQVSAILAIFSAGIAHSFNRKKFDPEKANLHAASDSVWKVLTFTLEGLVFVILGAQLPDILSTVQTGEYGISTSKIIFCVLILTLIFTLIRFLWSYFTISKKAYSDTENQISKVRASLIFSLSGARGAVTLAIVLSIPVFVSNGVAFPQRNLLILLAAGIILCSLILTNFVLPLFVEKENPQTKSKEEQQACVEILQNVIKELSAELNDENKQEMQIIIREYLHRIASLQDKKTLILHDHSADKKILAQIYEWENQNINTLYEKGEIDNDMRTHYLNMLRVGFNRIIAKKENPFNYLKKRFSMAKHIRRLFFMSYGKKKEYHQRVFALVSISRQSILDKLKAIKLQENNPAIDKFIFYYDFFVLLRGGRNGKKSASSTVSIEDIVTHAFQLERDNICIMLEQGRISRETAKEMRNNIALLETQIEG